MGIQDFIRERREALDRLAESRKRERRSKGAIRVKSRISEVLDPESAVTLFEGIQTADPLKFSGYADKVAGLARRSGLNDAFICAEGTIGGRRAVCCELVPEFLMGSMGTAVGEAVCMSAEHALMQKVPLIIFSASGGARMQEGMFSLMQMAKTSAAVRLLSDAGILYISVLTNPTTGGVTASFASLGDVNIAEPGALIGFAGPRVIEQTIRSTLPEGFQSAEFQRDHGFVDMIVPREGLRDMLSRLLGLHAAEAPVDATADDPSGPSAGGAAAGGATGASAVSAAVDAAVGAAKTALAAASAGVSPARQPDDAKSAKGAKARRARAKKPSEHVAIARDPGRPHAPAFIEALFDEFIELSGDRAFRDDTALIGGLASFEGRAVTVAAHLKGSELPENISCNFGMPHPEGYRKFIRLAKQAEKFGRPVITLIDTPGAYPGAEAEERGQGEAIAHCLYELSGLKVPTIAVVTGEGGSGGALALGLTDRVYMYEYAIYSVLSPEGFASILWKDAKRASEASEVMKLTAQDLEGFQMIDGIIAEPRGGAHKNPLAAIEALRPVLRAALEELGAKDMTTLLMERYDKYRKFR